MNSVVVVTRFSWWRVVTKFSWWRDGFLGNKGDVPNGGDRLKYRMTGAGRGVESLTRVVWRNKSAWWLFGPSIYIFSVGSETAIFVPRGKRSDWIFINVFFLLIYRKRKFCAEPMRERLTFHFELRTRSINISRNKCEELWGKNLWWCLF